MQHEPLTEQIERLIQTGELPRDVQASSALLLGRLQSVITVRLMGPDRDRKAALIAALADCHLPPLPTAEIWLQYGERHETVLHFHDGSSQVFDREDAVADLHPVRVDITAPIPALELLSFHLVGELDGSKGARLTGSHAFQDADIVVWCTTSFDVDEAAQWASASDRLKDHSFLVSLRRGASLDAAALRDLQHRAEQEFYALHHIDIGATKSGATDALMSDVFQIAKSGRRADQDGAALLLKTYEKVLARAAPLELAPLSMRRRKPTENKMKGVYTKALTLIKTCAREVSDPMPGDSSDELSRVLTHCADTSQLLADLFDGELHEDAAFQGLREDVLTASDQLTLMTLEDGLVPAIDAVTTLVQLKREFEMRCAA